MYKRLVEKCQKRLLTVREAAHYLGISERSLYNATGPKSKRRLPIRVKRIGRSIRFDVRDLEEYVDSL